MRDELLAANNMDEIIFKTENKVKVVFWAVRVSAHSRTDCTQPERQNQGQKSGEERQTQTIRVLSLFRLNLRDIQSQPDLRLSPSLCHQPAQSSSVRVSSSVKCEAAAIKMSNSSFSDVWIVMAWETQKKQPCITACYVPAVEKVLYDHLRSLEPSDGGTSALSEPRQIFNSPKNKQKIINTNVLLSCVIVQAYPKVSYCDK